MKVLTVFAHPRRRSFTGALLDRFVAGASEAGHELEIADLYREGFTTFFTPDDYAQFEGGPMPDDVRREQARIDAAEGLAFVYPFWWWSFPAILKNWIDRVFCEGWAYHFELEGSKGLLSDRPVVILGSCGSSARTFRRYGCHEAVHNEIDIGTFGYCGLSSVRRHMFYEVDDRPDLRERYLAEAGEIGRRFPDPYEQVATEDA
jgi:NAD(P)H dehydrogenase (quinone)